MQAPLFIQTYCQKRSINKVSEVHRPEKKIININDAKEIGMVYFLNNDDTYKTISAFVKKLQLQNRNVKAIAYVKDKKLTQRYLPKLSYDFFYDKDLNWYGKPGGKYIEEFQKGPFDILMDLSDGNHFPLKYLVSGTNAKMKIGLYSDKNKDILDLFIKTDNLSDLNHLIDQIEYYLSIINKN